MATLINLILFQTGWFSCVLGAAHQSPWFGTLVSMAVVGVHLARAADPWSELKLVLLSGLVGLVLDSRLVSLDLIHYASGTLIDGLAPHWIVAMWMLFGTTLNITFRWLKGRWLLACVLGFVAGPLAYYGGARLGAAELSADTSAALLGVALVWAVGMPLLLWLSDRYDGIATHSGDASRNRD